MSEIIFVKFIALCECFTTKHKCTETSTRYCQHAAGLDEGLNERSISRVTIYVATVIFMVTILASMLLEAV